MKQTDSIKLSEDILSTIREIQDLRVINMENCENVMHLYCRYIEQITGGDSNLLLTFFEEDEKVFFKSNDNLNRLFILIDKTEQDINIVFRNFLDSNGLSSVAFTERLIEDYFSGRVQNIAVEKIIQTANVSIDAVNDLLKISKLSCDADSKYKDYYQLLISIDKLSEIIGRMQGAKLEYVDKLATVIASKQDDAFYQDIMNEIKIIDTQIEKHAWYICKYLFLFFTITTQFINEPHIQTFDLQGNPFKPEISFQGNIFPLTIPIFGNTPFSTIYTIDPIIQNMVRFHQFGMSEGTIDDGLLIEKFLHKVGNAICKLHEMIFSKKMIDGQITTSEYTKISYKDSTSTIYVNGCALRKLHSDTEFSKLIVEMFKNKQKWVYRENKDYSKKEFIRDFSNIGISAKVVESFFKIELKKDSFGFKIKNLEVKISPQKALTDSAYKILTT